MKKSILTGAYIYNTINGLQKDVTRIKEAMEVVADQVTGGAASTPYMLLNDELNRKETEVKQLCNAEYELQ